MDGTRRMTILGTAALTLAPDIAWADAPIGGRAFGSTWRLTGEGVTRRAAARIEHHARQVDATMSPYRRMSLISRFNRADTAARLDLPPFMEDVVRAAIDIHRASDGAFDPTVGPVVNRYGFGPILGGGEGIDDIVLEGGTLRKSAAEVTLDLCGIAKGYALDAMIDDLRADGATDILLELGGETRALGRHPTGRPWQIAIEDPLSPGPAARHVVRPGSLALATSGHAANGIPDRRLSHVIDPRTERPATGFAASVSVLAETAMRADAWATALVAMGAGGPDFARAHGISALFILGGAAGGASILIGDFARHILV